MPPFGNLFSKPRKHKSLYPMLFFIGLGLSTAGLYLLRLTLRDPHISWNKKGNPEPWNNLKPTHQYKFIAVSMDYDKLKKDRPDF